MAQGRRAKLVYTRDLLENVIIPRDHCTVDLDSLPERLDGKVNIPFVCQCGTPHSKLLYTLYYRAGAFCVPCSKQQGDTKNKAAKAASEAVVNTTTSWSLEQSDGVSRNVELDDVLALVIAPRYLPPRIVPPNANPRYQVVFWDFNGTPRQTCKTFTLDMMVNAKEAASRVYEEQIQVTNNHRDDVYHVTVSEVLKNPMWYSKHFRLARLVTEYPAQDVPLDPWVLGTWLGDGTAGASEFTSVDPEIISGLDEYASSVGLVMKRNMKNGVDGIKYYIGKGNRAYGPNIFRRTLCDLGVFKSKHIPDIYKHNNVDIRYEVLAGLLDTDGYLGKSSYEFSQSLAHERLFDDVRELVHSLGLTMTKNHCIKTCMYKGVKKQCPAIRGEISGFGERLAAIPVRLARKKFVSGLNRPRNDLMKFQLVPRVDGELP